MPFTIGGFYDADDEEVRCGIAIPYVLSILAKHDPNATITGLDSVPAADRPPVNVVRFAFQAMAGIGTALGALAAVFLFMLVAAAAAAASRRGSCAAVIVAGPLALVALIGGWVATEVGRQPWIVYETMRTSDAVTGVRRARDRLRRAGRSSTCCSARRSCGCCGGSRAEPERELERDLMLPEICVGLVVLGITAYAVLGGADFGAGFWDLTAGGDARGGRVRGMVQRSMSPVWEANHVWLIFVLVITWTAFPVAFGSIFSTLSLPLFLAALGIISRGAAFALRGQAATMREARTLGAVFALSSVLVPFFLGAALGGIASGRVPVGNAAGDLIDSWLNPTSIAIGALARAHRRLPRGGLPRGRLRARRAAGPGRGVPRPRARRRDRHRRGGDRQPARRALRRAPAVRRAHVRRRPGRRARVGARRRGDARARLTRRYAVARLTAAAAVAAVTVGWALAQDPYLLPGELTLEDGAASDTVSPRSSSAVGIGFLILVPSLVYLYRLVLRGTLDQSLRAARPALPGGPVIRALGVLAAGGLLLFLFEAWYTRLAGVLLMFAAVALGVFAIATPEALIDDEPPEDG